MHIHLRISQNIADNCIINVFMNRLNKSEKTADNIVTIIICMYLNLLLFMT